jgi:hypothetical protein
MQREGQQTSFHLGNEGEGSDVEPLDVDVRDSLEISTENFSTNGGDNQSFGRSYSDIVVPQSPGDICTKHFFDFYSYFRLDSGVVDHPLNRSISSTSSLSKAKLNGSSTSIFLKSHIFWTKILHDK